MFKLIKKFLHFSTFQGLIYEINSTALGSLKIYTKQLKSYFLCAKQ